MDILIEGTFVETLKAGEQPGEQPGGEGGVGDHTSPILLFNCIFCDMKSFLILEVS